MVLNFNEYKTSLHKSKACQQTSIFVSRGGTHVYVHPELVFLADISYVVQWVKGTLNCGPWCAADKEWHCTLGETKWRWMQLPWILWFLVCRTNKMHQFHGWLVNHSMSYLILSEYLLTWDFASSIFSSRSAGIMRPLQHTREWRLKVKKYQQGMIVIGTWKP